MWSRRELSVCSLYFPEDAEIKDVLDQAEVTFPWLLQSGAKFVAKPDMLIKRRGKSGLLALNKTWAEARAWVAERAGKTQKVEHVEGVLRTFLVEPFVPHPANTEYYININSVREVSPAASFIFPRTRDRALASASVATRPARKTRVQNTHNKEGENGGHFCKSRRVCIANEQGVGAWVGSPWILWCKPGKQRVCRPGRTNGG